MWLQQASVNSWKSSNFTEVINLIFVVVCCCDHQVFEKLKLAEKTSGDIDRLRDGYRPAAKRGAILFFVLTEMALVNSMYQYSLASYLEVFDFSLRKSLGDSLLPQRLKNIMNTLTYSVYNYGCTGKILKYFFKRKHSMMTL